MKVQSCETIWNKIKELSNKIDSNPKQRSDSLIQKIMKEAVCSWDLHQCGFSRINHKNSSILLKARAASAPSSQKN